MHSSGPVESDPHRVSVTVSRPASVVTTEATLNVPLPCQVYSISRPAERAVIAAETFATGAHTGMSPLAGWTYHPYVNGPTSGPVLGRGQRHRLADLRVGRLRHRDPGL